MARGGLCTPRPLARQLHLSPRQLALGEASPDTGRPASFHGPQLPSGCFCDCCMLLPWNGRETGGGGDAGPLFVGLIILMNLANGPFGSPISIQMRPRVRLSNVHRTWHAMVIDHLGSLADPTTNGPQSAPSKQAVVYSSLMNIT